MRKDSRDGYAQTRPAENLTPELEARFELTSKDLRAVNEFCARIQSMAKSAGIAVRGPIPRPTEVKGGVKIFRRHIIMDADPGLVGTIVKTLVAPDGVDMKVILKETRKRDPGDPCNLSQTSYDPSFFF